MSSTFPREYLNGSVGTEGDHQADRYMPDYDSLDIKSRIRETNSLEFEVEVHRR